MTTFRMRMRRNLPAWTALITFTVTSTSCVYMKMNPPPDADKPLPVGSNNSCYLATAANLLAGSGYGSGTTVQARAENIYTDLTNHFGVASGGWTDTAISWWLSSSHNTWTSNPYTVVSVMGNKSPKYPWANANGARDIGNYLRECDMVGLSISWPTDASGVVGSGGHAITAWGDNGSKGTLSANPSQVRITDSDNVSGGDVQAYTYDAYTNPNPGGANEGNGWYFNYDDNHPYIKHIVTLAPTTTPSGTRQIQKVIGAYKIHQDQSEPATDLHYKVGTDVDILSYKTTIDWSDVTPTIVESSPQRRQLTVDWNLSSKPVPSTNWVTITTEFILPYWNAMKYDDVHFTYPKADTAKLYPSVAWELRTPTVAGAEKIPNVTGGYVIAAFSLADPRQPIERRIVAEYRLLHQYSYTQSPEEHEFILNAKDDRLRVTNLRFGHSYGVLNNKELWEFKNWMTDMGDRDYALTGEPIRLRVDWKGRLPYPEGEDIRGRIPSKKQGLRR